jgi:hypothetical protein
MAQALQPPTSADTATTGGLAPSAAAPAAPAPAPAPAPVAVPAPAATATTPPLPAWLNLAGPEGGGGGGSRLGAAAAAAMAAWNRQSHKADTKAAVRTRRHACLWGEPGWLPTSRQWPLCACFATTSPVRPFQTVSWECRHCQADHFAVSMAVSVGVRHHGVAHLRKGLAPAVAAVRGTASEVHVQRVLQRLLRGGAHVHTHAVNTL